jgi:hypothetical protein
LLANDHILALAQSLKIRILEKMTKTNKDFLKNLQKEATIQSFLQKERLMPEFLSNFSSFTAENLWKVLLFFSVLGAIIWQFLEK